MSADGRRSRLATALWLVFAFVVWHVRFDHAIDTAARTYLFTQHQYVLGRAPSVAINAAMRPAAAAAALDATKWSAVIAVTGLSAVAWAGRRSRRPSAFRLRASNLGRPASGRPVTATSGTPPDPLSVARRD